LTIKVIMYIVVTKFQEYVLEVFSGQLNDRSTKKIRLEVLNIIENVVWTKRQIRMAGRENGVAETIEENNCPRILRSYTKNIINK